ncbi:DUF5018 domain-containing protein [Allomuricauda sp. R78024]|uniref:DUF5018 domain-containing protein n=1 Tax=Allomuricauda sp. R78024 TaxID=3093867 RepID=UPI0037CC5871
MKRILTLVFGILLIYSCGSDSSESPEVPLSSDNFITTFIIKRFSSSFEANIQGNTITGLIPSNIALTEVTLDIEVSEGAKINPDPRTINSLTDAFILTITAEDGTKREYNVDIKRELSIENLITSFKLIKDDFALEPEIGDDNIVGEVPSNVELEGIRLEIKTSDFASIDPDPSSISEISEAFSFIVTAENGDEREYQIDISRIISTENEIVSFKIFLDSEGIEANVDDNGNISKRLPSFLDLANLTNEVAISKFATIEPDPNQISDFSSEVVFTVTAENGDTKNYNVNFKVMDENFEIRCDSFNVSKWFGGDARDDINLPQGPFDRNVGTGQVLTLNSDSHPDSFGVLFSNGFVFRESGIQYTETVELNLNIRDSDGNIVHTTTTVVPGSFRGGWVYFDLSSLNIFLAAEKKYIFTWYLINGGELGITTGSYGDMNEGPDGCNGLGYSGQSRVSFDQNLDDWGLWWEHPWHFNYRISGKE